MTQYPNSSLSVFCAASALFTTQVFATEVQSAIPVTIEVVAKQVHHSSIEEVGKVKATDSAALTFSAGEKLKALNFEDGDQVKQGDVIAQLDDAQARAELDKAQSSLALAESKLDRVLALLKKQPDSMSAQDVEELKQQANLARADFRQKQTDLNNYQLVAPFDGQLTNFTHSVGSRVEAATALVSLIKLDPVEVHYSISQNEVGQAELGQPVSISVDAYPNQSFVGRVNYIAPLVDENSGRVEIHAHLGNQNKQLVPGMFAKVSQSVGKETAELVVSQTSIDTSGGQRFVWVIENDKAVKRSVELGDNTNNGYVTIQSGLKSGEMVVVTGRQNLRENSVVAVQNSPSNVTLPSHTLPAGPKQAFGEELKQPKKREANKPTKPSNAQPEEVTNEAA